MRHVYDCPLRWADLDLLGHVNNVVYIDYLQEARVDMLRSQGRPVALDGLGEGVVVVRHEVSYLAPLTFGFVPVRIECWVTSIRAASFTIAYEVFHEHEEGREVYLRASTVLTPYVFAEERPRRLTVAEKASLGVHLEEPAHPAARPVMPEPGRSQLAHYPLQVRFSDVDAYGHVNNVKYFEYFQEARILMTAELWGSIAADRPRASIVVAQTDVDYRAPILFRPEPYDVVTWVERVGTRSFVFGSSIEDGGRLLARAKVVAVFFDQQTQRSTEPPAAYRDPLLAALAG